MPQSRRCGREAEKGRDWTPPTQRTLQAELVTDTARERGRERSSLLQYPVVPVGAVRSAKENRWGEGMREGGGRGDVAREGGRAEQAEQGGRDSLAEC